MSNKKLITLEIDFYAEITRQAAPVYYSSLTINERINLKANNCIVTLAHWLSGFYPLQSFEKKLISQLLEAKWFEHHRRNNPNSVDHVIPAFMLDYSYAEKVKYILRQRHSGQQKLKLV